MVERDGPNSGTVLTGGSAGETFTIDQVPATSTGISRFPDRHRSTPTVETLTLSTGVVEHRLCTRSRVFSKVSDETENHHG